MTAQDPRSVLLDALQREGAERSRLLEDAAGGDPEAAARVEALAKAFDEATTAVRPPTIPTPQSRPVPAEGPGDRIGPYTLGSCIGEGGFGRVFRATQTSPVRRELALKLLKPGMDSEAVLRRFDAERQALARLNHPGIARIYDAGATPSGRPYFAMELVDGTPITSECDRLRLSIPERLELFQAVCLAVQHAHQKGVVHRDLKPSNVLVTIVDAKPQPKIIDFGIAKAIDEPLTDFGSITQARQVIGTPRYMSPEQADQGAQGDVDSRTDVYSLGVLLYELLTGTTPLTDNDVSPSDWTGLAERLRHGVFPAPSARLRAMPSARQERVAERRSTTPDRLRRALTGDLDWITLRALEPDPARRYPTAFALARDVERSLAHETVDARPPDRIYRAKKFVRRNRVGVLIASVVTLALVTVTLTEFWTLRRVQAESRTTQAALAEAQAVTDFLARTFTALDAETVGVELRFADVLRKASAQIDSTDGAGISIAAQSRLHSVLGTSYWELGEWRPAEHHLRRSLALTEQIGRRPTPRQLQTALNLAGLVYERGEPESALRLMREIERPVLETFGPESDHALGFLGNYALIAGSLGRNDEALELERRVVETRERADGPDAARTIGAMVNLARRLDTLGRSDEAHATLLDADTRARRALDPDASERVLAAAELAWSHLDRGEGDLALAGMRSVLASRERTLGPDHPRSAHAAYNLAAASIRLGQAEEAGRLLHRVLSAVPHRLPLDHPVAIAAMDQCAVLGTSHGWDKLPPGTAERLIELVRTIPIGTLPAMRRNDIALILCTIEPHSLRDYPLAEILLTSAVTEAESDASESLYFYLDSLGQLRHEQGRYEEAITAFQRALGLTPDDRLDHKAEIQKHLDRTRHALRGG